MRTITDLKVQCDSSLNLRGKQIKGWHVHAETENNVQCETIKKARQYGRFRYDSGIWRYRSLNLVAVFFDLNHVQNGKQIILKNYRIINNEEECFIPMAYMFQ